VGIKRTAWAEELKKFTGVGMDSSLVIYHLEGMAPYADLTETLFAAVLDGSMRAILSTISITELLVRPFTKDQLERITAFERFLFSLPNTDLVPPSYAISKEGARLRAKYRIRTPDAILLATSLIEKAEAFLTNDARLRMIKDENLNILVLDDFIDL
jgi:predicted nucleic acid-binding protein